jgi:extracellular factor (EF) 3-hydroxypalmitic acid methyl ester biosynthesis protein
VSVTAPDLNSVPVALRPLHEPALHDPVGLLDSTRDRILGGGDVAQAVDILSDGLWWMRSGLPAEDWQRTVALVRAHPLMGLMHENPFTRRAFVKPRGYAGDAPLIDLLYYGAAAAEAKDASPLGLALLARDTAAPAAAAVRERRDFMAELIDHVADARPMPAILVAACGHLREGLVSTAVQQHRIGRLVALDQDAESLAVAGKAFGIKGIEAVNRSIKAVLDGSFKPGSFDMVYAAGLYDYLGQRLATALTTAFFSLLRPGGRLVVGNFATGIYDAGYMEAIADWFLIYRDAAEMLDLAGGVAPGDLAMKRVYTRQSPDIFYLELRRRSALAA